MVLLALASAASIAVTSQVALAGGENGQPSASLTQGRELFLNYCAGCHGERGDGKTASGLAMRPPAFDLTNFELADSLLWRVLLNGVLGSEMPNWPKTLVGNQMASVVAYAGSLGRRDTLAAEQRFAPDHILQEAGRRVYVAHCARCHGETGRGDGPEAERYEPPPADFQEMRPGYAPAERAITAGVPGTAMPAFPRLTPAEIQALAFYLRSLYRGPERPLAGPELSVRLAQR